MMFTWLVSASIGNQQFPYIMKTIFNYNMQPHPGWEMHHYAINRFAKS